jgi:hypothetical protein
MVPSCSCQRLGPESGELDQRAAQRDITAETTVHEQSTAEASPIPRLHARFPKKSFPEQQTSEYELNKGTRQRLARAPTWLATTETVKFAGQGEDTGV